MEGIATRGGKPTRTPERRSASNIDTCSLPRLVTCASCKSSSVVPASVPVKCERDEEARSGTSVIMNDILGAGGGFGGVALFGVT